MRGSIINYNKYIKNTLMDLTDMFEFSFTENIVENYKTYNLMIYNDVNVRQVDVINIPNYIDNKINEVVGDLKDFFSFQDDSYILNYNSEKDTIALRAETIVYNYNYQDETKNDYFRNIIEGSLISEKLNKYSAVIIDIDFSDLYTIKYDGITNNIIYSDKTITIDDLYSSTDNKSKTYEIYSYNKDDEIPKYRINGAILSLPAGLLLSSTDTSYNIRKNGNALEINSGGEIKFNSPSTITMDSSDQIILSSDEIEMNATEIKIGTTMSITEEDITITTSELTGVLTIGEESGVDEYYLCLSTE